MKVANSPTVNPYLYGTPKFVPNFLPTIPASISFLHPSIFLPKGFGTSTTINCLPAF
jgi:hypothetical protein